MVGLMDVLRKHSREKPNAIELMFATHPMSDERYETAQNRVKGRYAASAGLPSNADRYMDATANLRKMTKTVEAIQNGDKCLGDGGGRNLRPAQEQYATALRATPDDYEALLKSAKCLLAQENPREALRYARHAKAVYPQEAQAYHVSGFAALQARDFGAALQDFDRYAQVLPGNPNTLYFGGCALDGMSRYQEAADRFTRFLQQVSDGEYAQHAYQRLVEMGYVKPQQQNTSG
jgi:beta-barrel assembly-enhancing protease